MRVLLSTYGTRGDVEPLVALSVRLKALGVHVRMCTPSDEEFVRRLTDIGVQPVPLGPPIRALTRGTTPPSAAELSRYRAEVVDAQFDVLPTAIEGCDVLMASGLAQIGARSVAEAAGVRYLYATYAATNLPSPHHPPPPRAGWPDPEVNDNRTLWQLDADKVNAQYAEQLNGHRAALGLSAVGNVRDHVITDRPWLAADPALGPWPETPGLDVTQTGAWTLPDERPLPAELVAFLDAGAPPIYVGFGSLPPSEDIAKRAIEAIRAHGHRAVVSHGWAGLDLVDDRDDCFAVGEVNQQRLFRRVAAVLHHGGAGTVLAAAEAGVPQVVAAPQVADPPYWAGRVAELGIGVAHEGPPPTTESLRIAFQKALAPETRERARTLSTTIRTDGAAVAASLLVDALG